MPELAGPTGVMAIFSADAERIGVALAQEIARRSAGIDPPVLLLSDCWRSPTGRATG